MTSSYSDTILFDSPEKQLSRSIQQIRQQEKSAYDRLHSIKLDSVFVRKVTESFSNLPTAVNERCGRWYVPTGSIDAAVYFKSTDGHTDHCKFSLRRLNLHITPMIALKSGMIVVDSTRRGKRMPDALSKTLPIWCAVINRVNNILLQRGWTAEVLELQTPPRVVSRNEHQRISGQIDGWAQALIATGIGQESFSDLSKPLRPIWVTPESTLPEEHNELRNAEFYPIVLVTASRCVPDGYERLEGFSYVQGAADDEEMWASGLKPDIFWSNADHLLDSGPLTLEHSMRNCIDKSHLMNTSKLASDVEITRVRQTGVYLTNALRAQHLQKYKVIDLAFAAQLTTESPQYLHLGIDCGKRGDARLHKAFESVEQFISTADSCHPQILISDEEDCKSKAAIVALFLLAVYYSEKDVSVARRTKFDKTLLTNKVVVLVNSRAGLNPSRAALKSLNEHLMSPAYRK